MGHLRKLIAILSVTAMCSSSLNAACFEQCIDDETGCGYESGCLAPCSCAAIALGAIAVAGFIVFIANSSNCHSHSDSN